MPEDTIDALEALLVPSSEEPEPWIRYVDSGFPHQVVRIRNHLRNMIENDPLVVGPHIGLLYLETRTGDSKSIANRALELFRRAPSSKATEGILAPEQTRDLQSLASRLNIIAKRLAELRQMLGLKLLSPQAVLVEVESILDAEPRAFSAQRFFFRVARETAAVDDARRMFKKLYDQGVYYDDLGLSAGKVLEDAGDLEGCINMYALALAEAPRNPEVPQSIMGLVARNPGLASSTRERLETIRGKAKDPALLDRVLDGLARVDRSTQGVAGAGNSPSPQGKPPTGDESTEAAIAAWMNYAVSSGTYDATMQAARELERLGDPGRAEFLYCAARRLHRGDVEALNALTRLREKRRVSGTGREAVEGSGANGIDDLSGMLRHARTATGEEQVKTWVEAAQLAGSWGMPWLMRYAALRGNQPGTGQGADVPSVLPEDVNPTVSEIGLLFNSGATEDALEAFRSLLDHLGDTSIFDIAHAANNLLDLRVPGWLPERPSRKHLLAALYVGCIGRSKANELGLDLAESAAAEARYLLVNGREAEAGTVLAEAEGIHHCFGALLRGEFDRATAKCRTFEALLARTSSSVEALRPRRIPDTSDRKVVNHARMAWETYERAIASESEAERKSMLEDAAFRFGLAAQVRGAGREIALFDEGIIRGELGQHDVAVRCLREASAALPRDGGVLWALTLVEWRRGRGLDAFAVAEKLLDVDAEHANARLLAAIIAFQFGAIERALELLLHGALVARNETAGELAVRCAERLGRADAWARVRDALDPRNRPSNAVVERPDIAAGRIAAQNDTAKQQYSLKQLEQQCFELVQVGRGNEAIAFIDRYIAGYPSYVPARLLRHRIMARIGNHREAIVALEEMAQGLDEKQRAIVLKVMAECLVYAGRAPEAMRILDRYVLPVRGQFDEEAIAIRREASRQAAKPSPLTDNRTVLTQRRDGPRAESVPATQPRLQDLAPAGLPSGVSVPSVDPSLISKPAPVPTASPEPLVETQGSPRVPPLQPDVLVAPEVQDLPVAPAAPVVFRSPPETQEKPALPGTPAVKLPREYLDLEQPIKTGALYAFVDRLLAQHRYDEVILSLQDLSRRSPPRFVPVLAQLGRVLIEAGRPYEAEEPLMRALHFSRPDMMGFQLSTLLKLHLDQGRIDKAVSLLSSIDVSSMDLRRSQDAEAFRLMRAVAEQEESSTVLRKIAIVLMTGNEGNRTEAMEILQQAYDANPGDPAVVRLAEQHRIKLRTTATPVARLKSQWERLYKPRFRHDEALRLIRRQRMMAGDQPREYIALENEVLLTIGDFPAAIQLQEELVQATNDRKDLLELARLHGLAGHDAEEVQIYQTLLARNPFDADVHERLSAQNMLYLHPVQTSDVQFLRECQILFEGSKAEQQRRLYDLLQRRGITPEVASIVRILRERQPEVLFWRRLEHSILEPLVGREAEGSRKGTFGAVDEVRPKADVAQLRPDPLLPGEAPVQSLVLSQDVQRAEGEKTRRFRAWDHFVDRDDAAKGWTSSLKELCPRIWERTRGEQRQASGASPRYRVIAWNAVDYFAREPTPERLDAFIEALWALRMMALLDSMARQDSRGRAGRRGPGDHAFLQARDLDRLEKTALALALEALAAADPSVGIVKASEAFHLIQRMAGRLRADLSTVARTILDASHHILAFLRSSNLNERRDGVRAAELCCLRMRDFRFNHLLTETVGALRHLASHWQNHLDQQNGRSLGDAHLEVILRPRIHEERTSSRFTLGIQITNRGEVAARDVELKIAARGEVKLDPAHPPAMALIAPGATVPVEFTVSDPGEAHQTVEVEGEVRFIATADGMRDVVAFGDVVLPPWSTVRGVRIERNPYKAGQPLLPTDAACVRRHDLVEQVKRALGPDGRSNFVMLYGLRRVGKTSLVYDLLADPPDRCKPVYFNMERFKNSDVRTGHFLRLVAETIESQARELGVPLEEGPPEDWVGQYSIAFDRFLTRMRKAVGERHFLLFIDEFEILIDKIIKGHIDQEVLAVLRNMFQHERWLGVVVIGANQVRDLVSGYDNTLFNLFIQVQVGFLSEAQARELITRPLGDVLRFDGLAIEMMIRETAGHPFLLQDVCRRLVELLNDHSRGQATVLDVRRIVDGLLDGIDSQAASYFHSVFHELGLKADEQLVLAIVAGLTQHQNRCTVPDIEQRLGEIGFPMDSMSLYRALERAVSLSILVGKGRPDGVMEYAVRIPLFGRWIQQHEDLARLIGRALTAMFPSDNDPMDDQPDPLLDVPEDALLPVVKDAQSVIEVLPSLASFPIADATPVPGPMAPRQELLRPEAPVSLSPRVIPASISRNPYVPGRPVSLPDEFFGREDYRRTVADVLCTERGPSGHIQVHGPRRMGKTSLLHYAMRIVKESLSDRAHCIFWDSSRFTGGGWQEFLRRLHQLIRDETLSLPGVAGLGDFLTEDSIFKLLKQISQSGHRVYLLLDEFQGFITKGKLSVDELTFLRSLTQDPGISFSYVISTSLPLKEFSRESVSSTFDNVFTPYRCGPLSREAALAMVEEPARRVGFELPEGAASRIHRFCMGQPFHTAICSMVMFQMMDGGGASFDEQAFEKRCAEELEDHFERALQVCTLEGSDYVKRCVENHYTTALDRTDGSPAQKAAERSGLFHCRAGTMPERLEPLGSLADLFLRRRFAPDTLTTTVPASEASLNRLRSLIHSAEPLARDVIAGEFDRKFNAGWTPETLPEDWLQYISHERSDGTLEIMPIADLCFGDTLKILQRMDPFTTRVRQKNISPKQLRSDVFELVQIRNVDTHNRRALSKDEVAEASRTLHMLLDVLREMMDDLG